MFFKVGNRDTLTSVAARFDTTPSELSSINKLNSSFIYPGQQLLVPDKSASKDDTDDGTSTSGKSSPVDGKSRKTSSDEIPKEEKGKVKKIALLFLNTLVSFTRLYKSSTLAVYFISSLQ